MSYLAAGKRRVHEARSSRLPPETFSIYHKESFVRRKRDANKLTHLKDCPHRRLVSRHNSTRLTGSLRHCKVRSIAMSAQSSSRLFDVLLSRKCLLPADTPNTLLVTRQGSGAKDGKSVDHYSDTVLSQELHSLKFSLAFSFFTSQGGLI